jgi:predicted MFS family arabinose efflux permease
MDATLPTAASTDRQKLHQRLKSGTFALELLHGIATAYYTYWVFFFMEKRFGFDKADNLLLAACYGFTYMFSASRAGRLAHRFGYFAMLRYGFVSMGVSSVIGALAPVMLGYGRAALYVELVVFVTWTFGASFVWPNLQALLSRESPGELPRTVGIYNIIWAAGSAASYFTGGLFFDLSALGTVFWLPAAFNVLQLLLLVPVHKLAAIAGTTHPVPVAEANVPSAPNPRDTARARAFLRLALIANPLSYVAIYGFVPVIPQLAAHFNLTPTYAGFVCSAWMWVRMGAFMWFSLWPGWHYRFRWLLASFIALIASFIIILLGPNLWLLILAQLVFGLAIGLVYSSSLYYSMDVGASRSKRGGGIHEAVIGFGIGAGSAVGFGALRAFPLHADAATWAIAAVLSLGFIVFLFIRFRWWHDGAS